jgi:hypothetical protein
VGRGTCVWCIYSKSVLCLQPSAYVRGKGVSEMRRVVVLLTVAGVLAAMLVLAVGAATAQPAAPTELRASMTGKQVVLP